MRPLFFLIFIAGIGNTVLRPEIENPFTLYRFLAPLGLIALMALRPMLAVKGLGWFALFAAYNAALAAIYGGGYSQLLPSLVHYFYLGNLLILMIFMKDRYPDFDNSFLRFAQVFYVFLLLNLALETVTGSYYPNLYEDTTDEESVRAFFWNQNDLAVVLCVIGWFALTLDRFKGAARLFVILVTFAVLYYNDSKAALLSFAFFSLPIYLIFKAGSKARIPQWIWYATFAGMLVVAVVALIYVSDVDIQFANDTYTLGDLLVQPIINIITMQASGEDLGSLNNRTDAAIFVIIEYIRSYGLGLGAGGSWLVLTLPQYELGGAQSPHNALLQFIIDFGYPVLLGYAALVIWALKRLFRYRLGEIDRLKVMAVLSFPMLGLSQSGAIVTNYFFFGSVFFILLLGRPLEARFRRAAVRTSRPPASRSSARPGSAIAAGA